MADTPTPTKADRRIEQMPILYNLLVDREAFVQVNGDKMLMVEHIDFPDMRPFINKAWEKIYFKDCCFFGISSFLRIQNCIFENCLFMAQFQAQVMDNVVFLRCRFEGESYLLTGMSSVKNDELTAKALVFKECAFIGSTSDRNRRGAISPRGDVYYEACRAKWFDVAGMGKVVYKNCAFEESDMICGEADENDPIFAEMIVDGCTLTQTLRIGANLRSLIFKNNTFDYVSLAADILGDAQLSDLRGGFLNIRLDQAQTVTLKNCVLEGYEPPEDYDGSFQCTLGDKSHVDHLIVENIKCREDKTHDEDFIGNCLHGKVTNVSLKDAHLPVASFMLAAETATLEKVFTKTFYFSKTKIDHLTIHEVVVSENIIFNDAKIGSANFDQLRCHPGVRPLMVGSSNVEAVKTASGALSFEIKAAGKK
ncbi:MAG: hypothetical protein LBG61_01180 [Burkholderiales bacterium]|jgi:uncharacterized protein YjbI with pentapeptide repeats|nr:hypothetical protein [Burkholderiales bacterium]